MLTPGNKIGLILAFLLGLSDIAILGALSDDDGPPIPIVAISVAIGVITLALVVTAWHNPTRPLILGIVALRMISGLGDAAAFGAHAVVVAISMVFLALCVLDGYLLRNWLKNPSRRVVQP